MCLAWEQYKRLSGRPRQTSSLAAISKYRSFRVLSHRKDELHHLGKPSSWSRLLSRTHLQLFSKNLDFKQTLRENVDKNSMRKTERHLKRKNHPHKWTIKAGSFSNAIWKCLHANAKSVRRRSYQRAQPVLWFKICFHVSLFTVSWTVLCVESLWVVTQTMIHPEPTDVAKIYKTCWLLWAAQLTQPTSSTDISCNSEKRGKHVELYIYSELYVSL